ncbi:MAG: beta-aspartyl-peptidase [Flavobacteriales bacterium]|jgi:beta-aspartyl-dipeptidase (metallo-type)|nr:beta-aspartyl-peptidase [Flavobacteriales bacterium]|tara:strand:- start:1256 stop:2392 length:1137 start_codon:yes stop_codon:yes gene_type:complete
MLLIKNANVYAPESLGIKDLLIANGSIQAIENNIEKNKLFSQIWDAQEKIVTPGIIDQHVHIIGAGGKNGFHSMTPEIKMTDLISCGTTTVVGLLGTDGSSRSIKTLNAKTKSLINEGISAYMYTGYYGLDPIHLTESVKDDMMFIDNVLGCKIALADIRSSYPTPLELVRLLKDIRVGGMLASKKGILHIHLGALTDKMDILFDLVENYEFPIEHISPTHVGRTKDLFEQAIKFAKLGGMIDITTGASKYTDPYKSVLYALERGVDISKITFSSDGNAGLEKLDDKGKLIGFRKAPVDKNLEEVISLIKKGGVSIEDAFKIITKNPANNLGLSNKGIIKVGADADFCVFDSDLKLMDVLAHGVLMMENYDLKVNDSF